MTQLTVIILTFNEEIHISRVISNVIDWAEKVYVLDSGSTDATCKIAEEYGAKVFYRKFDNYSNQRNYAIKELLTTSEWILFLDADEYLSDDLKEEISSELMQPKADGYYLKRYFKFMGKQIRWGGYSPIWILRLFKKDKGLFQREINEHLVLDGKSAKLTNHFLDDNKESLKLWWYKHIDYAYREAEDLIKSKSQPIRTSFWGSQADRKLWIRYKIWNRLPVYFRPCALYFYRYVIRLGFLDGRSGFIYYFYHGLVYTMMIDSFYLELKGKHNKK